MNRRAFLRGVSVMALAAKLNFADPEPKGMMLSEDSLEDMVIEIGNKMSHHLARSMIQTKEVMMAEVLKWNGDGEPPSEYKHVVYGTRMWIDQYDPPLRG